MTLFLLTKAAGSNFKGHDCPQLDADLIMTCLLWCVYYNMLPEMQMWRLAELT